MGILDGNVNVPRRVEGREGMRSKDGIMDEWSGAFTE